MRFSPLRAVRILAGWLAARFSGKRRARRVAIVGSSRKEAGRIIAAIQGGDRPFPHNAEDNSFQFTDESHICWQICVVDTACREVPPCDVVLYWTTYDDALRGDSVAALAVDNPGLLGKLSNPSLRRVGLLVLDTPGQLPRDSSQCSLYLRGLPSRRGVSEHLVRRIAEFAGRPGEPLADEAWASALRPLLGAECCAGFLDTLYRRRRSLALFFPAGGTEIETRVLRRWIAAGWSRPRSERLPLWRWVASIAAGSLAVAAWAFSGPLPVSSEMSSGSDRPPEVVVQAVETRWAAWNESWISAVGGPLPDPPEMAIEPAEAPEVIADAVDHDALFDRFVSAFSRRASETTSVAACADLVASQLDLWDHPPACGLAVDGEMWNLESEQRRYRFAARFEEQSALALARCVDLAKRVPAARSPSGTRLPSVATLFRIETDPGSVERLESLLGRLEPVPAGPRIRALLGSSDIRSHLRELSRLDLTDHGLSISPSSLADAMEAMPLSELGERWSDVRDRCEAVLRFARAHPANVDRTQRDRLRTLCGKATSTLAARPMTIQITSERSLFHFHLSRGGVWDAGRNLPPGRSLAVTTEMAYGGEFSILLDENSQTHYGSVPSGADEMLTIQLRQPRQIASGMSFEVVDGWPNWPPEKGRVP